MTVDTVNPRSRRAILAGAAGAAAAFVATAIGRAAPVSAADGQPVIIGAMNTSTATTKITGGTDAAIWGAAPTTIGVLGTSTTDDGVVGETSSGVAAVRGYGHAKTGIRGESDTFYGAHGVSGSGIGVRGESSTSNGVDGFSASGAGVWGLGTTYGVVGVTAANQVGVYGGGGGGTGVVGVAGSPLFTPPPNTGVYGISTTDATSRAVAGETTSGRAINGVATNGRGVFGQAASGRGVNGYVSDTGVAGWFERKADTSGQAIRAIGRVVLDNCSGVATISAGASTVTVNPGIDLVTKTAVVATLQGDAGGSTTVKRVSVNTTANTFQIVLTANSTVPVKVAWHAFG